VSSNPALGEVYSIHHYVIKFVSDLRQSVGSAVSSTNKTDHHSTMKDWSNNVYIYEGKNNNLPTMKNILDFE
jgi:hypothetical protein